MEKITVQIGLALGRSIQLSSERTRDIKWMMRVLDCSWKRAVRIIDALYGQYKQARQPYLILVMDYKQLAKYTAYRATDDLVSRWVYPKVKGLVHDKPPELEYQDMPIECRPGRRTRDC